jgi:hypothetical protein
VADSGSPGDGFLRLLTRKLPLNLEEPAAIGDPARSPVLVVPASEPASITNLQSQNPGFARSILTESE